MAKFEIQPASRRGVSIKMEISTQNELHTATGNSYISDFHLPPILHFLFDTVVDSSKMIIFFAHFE